ncbi:hypothetical protein R6Q59_028556 [Mikania micrantha]|uniref:Cyclin-like domain-containing protein n=1 Tax=Mikania micrantha TaxID=192012 RepID=A0A5N6M6H3_9ASTR|nr:hypothetical protein E3N88_31733 [Mikania micrantha]
MTQLTPCTILDRKNGVLEVTDDHQFLLCDEVWDMSPVDSACSSNGYTPRKHGNNVDNSMNPITKQDFEHLFDAYVQKEIKYMTGLGYINLLQTNHSVAICRLKAINWFIHCQRRFNFCIGSVFKALNYLDRFIDMNKCHGWSYWMMELLSLASLTIAIKFGETCPPSLREIQEGLEYCFDAKLIQKMEMKILKSLGWELNSVTSCTYAQLIECELHNHLKLVGRSRLHEILLASSLDVKMLEYRPCVIAMSGLRCVLEDEQCLSHITSFIPKDQTQNIQSCYNKMQEILVGCEKSESNRNPSSPDTVLTKELQVAMNDAQIDLSFIDEPAMKDSNMIKRKRVMEDDDDDDCAIKHKKYVN